MHLAVPPRAPDFADCPTTPATNPDSVRLCWSLRELHSNNRSLAPSSGRRRWPAAGCRYSFCFLFWLPSEAIQDYHI
ncbi:unnamed protein product [Dicrocoelium dendriticum]|nr:unnamed protein product [Dicrocoelium dendriticum]